MQKRLSLLLATSLLLVLPASGQYVDPTFGAQGWVTPDFPTHLTTPFASSVIVIAGESLLTAGQIQNFTVGNGDDFVIQRHLSTGMRDATFGTDGFTLASPGSNDAIVQLVADQEVFFAIGATSSGPFCGDIIWAKYDKQGNRDTTLGDEGFVRFDFSSRYGEEVCHTPFSAAVQVNGKLLIMGLVGNANVDFEIFVAQFLEDGSLDPAFGTDGLVMLDFGGSELVTLETGAFLIAGTTPSSEAVVARFTDTGMRDTTFGINGRFTSEQTISIGTIEDLLVTADGAILLGGATQAHPATPIDSDFVLLRLTAEGMLDTTFGDQGFVTTDFFSRDDNVESIFLQPNGKILAVGEARRIANFQNNIDIAITRYLPNGMLDPGFGTNGRFTVDRTQEFVEDAVLQTDDRLVVLLLDFSMVGIHINDTGTTTEEQPAVPKPFTLTAFPNPARNEITLHLDVASSGTLHVRLYDLLGREVGQHIGQPLTSGMHAISMQTAGLAAGVYFFRARLVTQQGTSSHTGQVVVQH